MARHSLKVLDLLQDFKSVFEQFGTLCVEGLRLYFSFTVPIILFKAPPICGDEDVLNFHWIFCFENLSL